MELCEHRENADLLGRHMSSGELVIPTWDTLEAQSPLVVFIGKINEYD